jgi:hypothetical protein
VTVGSAKKKLVDDQPSLNGLAEPDVVSDQNPGGEPMSDGECRLELKRQKCECVAGLGAQRGRCRRGVRDRGADTAAPCRWPDEPRRARAREAIVRLARQDERRADALVTAIASAYVEQRAIGTLDVSHDAPALVANTNDIAGTQCRYRHAWVKCRRRSGLDLARKR